MPDSKNRRRRANEERRATMRSRFGPDWHPTYCQWCSTSEPVRRAAVVLPADATHPREMTLFCWVSAQPRADGTVYKDPAGERVAFHARYGPDARPVPLFRVADESTPREKLHRMHTASRCAGLIGVDELQP